MSRDQRDQSFGETRASESELCKAKGFPGSLLSAAAAALSSCVWREGLSRVIMGCRERQREADGFALVVFKLLPATLKPV